MIFRDYYWCAAERMDLLSRWIIVHSILYYELDSSIIDDKMFDSNCRQLVSMMRNNKQHLYKMRWLYVMKDFDGATGFDLYNKLNKLDKKMLLKTARYINWMNTMGRWD